MTSARSEKTKESPPFLPPLSGERSSLVSSTNHSLCNIPDRKVSEWASHVRARIDNAVLTNCSVSDEDISDLKQHLILEFIKALQEDSCSTWLHLQGVLHLILPYKNYLGYSPSGTEIWHYLERIIYHMKVYSEKWSDIHLVEILVEVFPQEIGKMRELGLRHVKDYCLPISLKREPAAASKETKPCLLLPDGMDPYLPFLPVLPICEGDDVLMEQKPMNVLDLGQSVKSVALDMAAHEAFWGHCRGLTAQAISVDFPEEISREAAEEPLSSLHKLEGNRPFQLHETAVKYEEEFYIQMMGREAVEYFSKCHHLGWVQHMYFNVAPNKHYQPYDLISVPRCKANAEHYVFSTFGVLCVHADMETETMSLAEWHAEAVIWESASKIPFFKNYLIRRMFHRWRNAKSYFNFGKRREAISKNLLQSIPLFGASLQHLMGMLKELLTIEFLTFDKKTSYSLLHFESAVNQKQEVAFKNLKRFFKSSKNVIGGVAIESFQKLKFCEGQIQKKTSSSKESIYLKRIKKEKRLENFKQAKHDTQLLGNFYKLVTQMCVEHLLEISKRNIHMFVYDIMVKAEDTEQRKGLFKTQLIFTDEDHLGHLPTVKMFSNLLLDIIKSFPDVMFSQMFGVSEPQDEEVSAQDYSQDSKQPARGKKFNIPFKTSLSLENEEAKVRENKKFPSCLPNLNLKHKESLPELSSLEGVCSVYPTRDEEKLRVATPELVIKPQINVLKVLGFCSEWHSLPYTGRTLSERLAEDTEFLQTIETCKQLFSEVSEHMKLFLEEHYWLEGIFKFCKQWTSKSLKSFKNSKVSCVEEQINGFKAWTDKLNKFSSEFLTENGLFYIDCHQIHDTLKSWTDDIYTRFMDFIMADTMRIARAFCAEMKTALVILKYEKKTMSEFSQLVRCFKMYQNNIPDYLYQLENTMKIFQLIRVKYRQLTPEEDNLDELLMILWKQFNFYMDQAAECINADTKKMEEAVENTFVNLKFHLFDLHCNATTGKFLDPGSNPVEILSESNKVRDKFNKCQLRLELANSWKASIRENSHKTDFIEKLSKEMDARHKVWKMFHETQQTFQGWNNTLINEFCVEGAMQKKAEWQAIAEEMKVDLPDADLVLNSWMLLLKKLDDVLPLLQYLSHSAFKLRHWESIFEGMDKPFIPVKNLKVKHLLNFDLLRFADIIVKIYDTAVVEGNMAKRLKDMKEFWSERSFELLKYFPASITSKKKMKLKRMSRIEKFRQHRNVLVSTMKKKVITLEDSYFILTSHDDLKYQIEDSKISIQTMLRSPYLGDLQTEVESLWDDLNQVEKILTLWITCQKKWIYLVKVFEKPAMAKKFKNEVQQFKTVNSQFMEWMTAVANDSRVFSVVAKKRGEKGFRNLQGEVLQQFFLSLIEIMNDLLNKLSSLMSDFKTEFSRFYFISNLEMVELQAATQDVPALMRFIRKFFPGIQLLVFIHPDSLIAATSFDLSLNVESLQVSHIVGALKEQVCLCQPVNYQLHTTKWLVKLESAMKDTMIVALQECVKEKIEGNLALRVPENFTKHEFLNIANSLLKFPFQMVIVAEAVIWEKIVCRAIKTKQVDDELKKLWSKICSNLACYIKVLRVNHEYAISELKQQIYLLLSALIDQAIHFRDATDELLSVDILTDNSFSWLKMMKYHMDYKCVLQAEPGWTAGKEKEKKNKDGTAKTMQKKTIMKTDYEFSSCFIHQMGRTFLYEYEYSGPFQHLVFTPLTDRAILSLTQSLGIYQCGTLIGPPGTGKAETVKELAKAFGQCLFLINCNKEISTYVLIQNLIGVIASGCWILLDHADRLQIGVMTEIAQHLDQLQCTLRALDVTRTSHYYVRSQVKSNWEQNTSEDVVIRRNSLVTLHSLEDKLSIPKLERQKVIPHGFSEKGLMAYIEEEWVTERHQRRHSVEREIKINESYPYKTKQQPSLYYEHIRKSPKKDNMEKPMFTQRLYHSHKLGMIKFSGQIYQASSSYGCFMTLNTLNPISQKIPENFRILMRPCTLVEPDVQQILDMMLMCGAFKYHSQWAGKLILFVKILKTWLPRESFYQQKSLKTLKTIVSLATSKLHSELQKHKDNENMHVGIIQEMEKMVLVRTIKDILLPGLNNGSDTDLFWNTLKDVFPNENLWNLFDDVYAKLELAVEEQTEANNLETHPAFVQKIISLYKSLEQTNAVILCGTCGSGKTTCLQVLTHTINMINYRTAMNVFAEYKSLIKKSPVTIKKSMVYNSVPGRVELRLKLLNQESAVPSHEENLSFPVVSTVHLYPSAMSVKEIFGWYEGKEWKNGILTAILKEISVSQEPDSRPKEKEKGIKWKMQKWIILDGVIDPLWSDNMKTLLGSNRILKLANREQVPVHENTKFIYETTEMSKVSPSILNCCSIIYCGSNVFHWTLVFSSWKKQASKTWLSELGLKLLECLVADVFPSTLKFLKMHCGSALLSDIGASQKKENGIAYGLLEVTSFFSILSALLNKISLPGNSCPVFSNRDLLSIPSSNFSLDPSLSRISLSYLGINLKSSYSVLNTRKRQLSGRHLTHMESYFSFALEEHNNYEEIIKAIFAFSFIWGFGAHLHERYEKVFSNFAREVLQKASKPIHLPPEGSVFDIYVNENSWNFCRWTNKQQDQVRTLSSYSITSDVERYTFVSHLLLNNEQQLLLIGNPGVGKTTLVQNVISKRLSLKFIKIQGTDTATLQNKVAAEAFHQKMKVKRTMMFRNNALIFLDDLNAARKTDGCQPLLELLRQMISSKYVYEKNLECSINNVKFFAACTLPTAPGTGFGAACHMMSSRLSRQFFNLNIFTPSPVSLFAMYAKGMQSWLEDFPKSSISWCQEFAMAIIHGTLDLYQMVKNKFKPSPACSFYIFNLHDMALIFKGMYLVNPQFLFYKIKQDTKNVDDDSERERIQSSPFDKLNASSCSTEKSSMEHFPPPPASLMRFVVHLWYHECSRTLSDRLVNKEDQHWFSDTLDSVAKIYFCSTQEQSDELAAIHLDSEKDSGCMSTSSAMNTTPLSLPVSNNSLPNCMTAEAEDSALQDVRLPVVPKIIIQTSAQELRKGFSGSADSSTSYHGEAKSQLFDIQTDLGIKQVIRKHPDLQKKSDDPAVPNHKNGDKCSMHLDVDPEVTQGFSSTKLKGSLKSFSNVSFSKFILQEPGKSDMNHLKGYSECSCTKLIKITKEMMANYNSELLPRMPLVYFEDAACHLARLTRVMAFYNGHGILLERGNGAGCRSLVKLAAHLAQHQLLELCIQESNLTKAEELNRQLRLAFHQVIVTGKPTVLFISDCQLDDNLTSICRIIADGFFPALYSADDLKEIFMQISVTVPLEHSEHMEQLLNGLSVKLKQNLHIFLHLSFKDDHDKKRICKLLNQYPELLKYSSCIDVYHPWTLETYSNIAEKWLEKDRNIKTLMPDSEKMDENVKTLCDVLGFIHQTSELAMQVHFRHQKALQSVSFTNFREFVFMFKLLSLYILSEEKAKMSKYSGAVGKLHEAFGSIHNFQESVTSLSPKHMKMLLDISNQQEILEDDKLRLKTILSECKEKEEEIYRLQLKLNKLKLYLKSSYKEVEPQFRFALKVLETLDKDALDEVRSYRQPSHGIQSVTSAICLMFGVEESWKEAKILLNKKNFIDDLVYYDKDHMPSSMLKKLKEYVINPDFTPESIKMASLAAASLCLWVNAVYSYGEMSNNMASQRKDMQFIQDQINQACVKLSKKRLEASQVKCVLKERLEAYKATMNEAKDLEKKITMIKKKIAKAEKLIGNISPQRRIWETKVKLASSNIQTFMGDALMTAACVCYHGPLDEMMRNKLLKYWIDSFCTLSFKNINTQFLQNQFTVVCPSLSKMKSAEIFVPEYQRVLHNPNFVYKPDLGDEANDESPTNLVFSECETDDEAANMLKVRKNFKLQTILSYYEELVDWRINDYPSDSHSITNVLIIRQFGKNHHINCPLLVDPDNQAVLWLKKLFNVRDYKILNEDESKSLRSSSPSYNLDEVSVSNLHNFTSYETNVSLKSVETKSSLTTESDATTFSDEEQGGVKKPKYSDVFLTFVQNNLNNFWVMEADDQDLEIKLNDAMKKGKVVLVTNLERLPINGFLLQLITSDILKTMDYQAGFSLYLSISFPCYLHGFEFEKLPLDHLYIIDLSLSDDSVRNKLLFETMHMERIEFESQRRANEEKIIQYRRSVWQEFELVREKTVNLEGPLLEDKTVLEALLSCKQNVEQNQICLVESHNVGSYLETKYAPYIPMVNQAAMIYALIKQVGCFHPYYYISFKTFQQIFVTEMRKRERRNEAAINSHQRAQELSDATTSAIFEFISSMMFEHHTTIFYLLVAIEKMRMMKLASDLEISIFLNGFYLENVDISFFASEKPEWISEKVWTECWILESMIPNFHGLQDSFIDQSLKWQEYFKSPLALLNCVPSKLHNDLTSFQKCIIWKICCPEKFAQIAHKLVVNEMGNVISLPQNYNIKKVFSYTDFSTPVIFIFPRNEEAPSSDDGSEGFLYVDPFREVKRLAKEVGMEKRVCIASYDQLDNMEQILSDSARDGNWLVVQNCNLSSFQNHNLFKKVLYSNAEDHSELSFSSEETVISNPEPACNSIMNINRTFRLWIMIQEAEHDIVLPGAVIQHGIKVTCETTRNFKSMFLKSYRSSKFLFRSWTPSENLGRTKDQYILSLAVFHSVLLQQRYYGKEAFTGRYHWTLLDLAAAVELCKRCAHTPDLLKNLVELVSNVYTSHCCEPEDIPIVHALALDTFKTFMPVNQATCQSQLMPHLFSQLLTVSETRNVSEAASTITDISSEIFGLPYKSEEALQQKHSRIFCRSLSKVTGMYLPTSSISLSFAFMPSMGARVSQLTSVISRISPIPKNVSLQMYPDDTFIQLEIQAYNQLVSLIKSDLKLLNRKCNKEIPICCHLQSVEEAIISDMVPATWLSKTFPSCGSLTKWIRLLSSNIQALLNYNNVFSSQKVHSLSAFLRPDRLILAVLQTHSRKTFTNIFHIKLKAQFVPSLVSPVSDAPEKGIYISGLRIHNASWHAKGLQIENPQISKLGMNNDSTCLWLEPVDATEVSDLKLLECPLIFSSEQEILDSKHIICLLHLPVQQEPYVFRGKRVHLTSSPVH